MRAQLVVSLVLLADLQMLILLEPGTWVAMSLALMAATVVLIVRISRRLIRSMRQSNSERNP